MYMLGIEHFLILLSSGLSHHVVWLGDCQHSRASSLKTLGGCSSKLLVAMYKTTCCHNPEDHDMNPPCHEKLLISYRAAFGWISYSCFISAYMCVATVSLVLVLLDIVIRHIRGDESDARWSWMRQICNNMENRNKINMCSLSMTATSKQGNYMSQWVWKNVCLLAVYRNLDAPMFVHSGPKGADRRM
jgi:hypothetical protein